MAQSSYIVSEHTRQVPLDHDEPNGPKIEIFAREVCSPGNQQADAFVFLQGGPGFAAPRDLNGYDWITELLKSHRVIFVDQRGTGRSTMIGPELAEKLPKVEDQARYFALHRADAIVRDLEILRKKVFKLPQWFLLGQSYGGFISFTYLSLFPEALKGVITTGGCPPFTAKTVRAVYERLVDGIVQRNAEFYKAHPKDADTVRRIVDLLEKSPYRLPDGGLLTARRFLDVGINLLGVSRYLDVTHAFLDDPFLDSTKRELSYAFVHNCTGGMSYETNPIYAVLHESIYCEGQASGFAAEAELLARKEFALDAKRPCFTGETIRKAMFDEYGLLKRYKKVAAKIAAKKDWGPLYDRTQLAANAVPVECLVYKTDYYVDYEYSMETVEVTKNARAYVHDTWQHDTLRQKGKDVIQLMLPRLLKRVR